MEFEAENIAKDVTNLKAKEGILDENDPDSARFMILIRNAMEDLQQQVETERSLYHKSREELSVLESKSRKVEIELNLEKERNSQLAQELERLEGIITEQNEVNDNTESDGNYWVLYKEALKRIDELESSLIDGKKIQELEFKKVELENEITNYKEIVSKYKFNEQKLRDEIDSLKLMCEFGKNDVNNIKKDYEEKIQDLTEKLSIEKIEHETALEQYNELQNYIDSINTLLRDKNYSSVENLIEYANSKNNEAKEWKSKLENLKNSIDISNERELSILSKENHLKDREILLSKLEEELKLKEESLNTKSKELHQEAFSVNNLKEELAEKQNDYEEILKGISEREQKLTNEFEELDQKLFRVNNLEKELIEKQKKYEIDVKELEFKEKNLTAKTKELDERTCSINNLEEDIKERQKRYDACINDFNIKEQNLNIKAGEIDRKNSSLISLEKEILEKQKEYEIKLENLNLKEQSLNNKAKELEYRTSSVCNLEKEILEKQKEYEAYVDDLNLREQSFNKMVEEYSMKMEKAQRQQESTHEKKLLEFEESKKELDSFKKEIEKQNSELKFQKDELEEKEKSLNKFKDDLELREQKFSQRIALLEEKEKQLNLKINSLNEFKQNSDIANSKKYEAHVKALEKEILEKNDEIKILKDKLVNYDDLNSKSKQLDEREHSIKELQTLVNSQKLDLDNKQKEFDIYINELENRQKEFEEFWFELNKRQRNIALKEKELENKETLLNSQKIALSDSEKRSLNEKEELLSERENYLKNRESKIVEKEKKLLEKEKVLLEKEMNLNDLERETNSLTQKNKIIEENLVLREMKIDERESSHKNRESALSTKEMIVIEKENNLDVREVELNQKEKNLLKKEENLNEQQNIANSKLSLCNELEATIKSREKEIDEREKYLEEREKQLNLERRPLIDELIRIEERDKELFERELAIQRNEDMLHEMEGMLKTREKELYEAKNYSSKDKDEINELRKMIEGLEIKNRDIEKETQRTCQMLQQQIQEEVKQKEDLLYTILHLHKQINEIGNNSTELNESKLKNTQLISNLGNCELNKNLETETKNEISKTVEDEHNIDIKSEIAKKNGDIIFSLEKAMKKLYEKLRATENREKSLLKELKQLTDKNKNSKYKNTSTAEKNVLDNFEAEENNTNHLNNQSSTNITDSENISKVQSSTNISNKNILPTLTNNSPLIYPESPMLLMPLLTDIKNEINELKKSNEVNVTRMTQTDEASMNNNFGNFPHSNFVANYSSKDIPHLCENSDCKINNSIPNLHRFNTSFDMSNQQNIISNSINDLSANANNTTNNLVSGSSYINNSNTKIDNIAGGSSNMNRTHCTQIHHHMNTGSSEFVSSNSNLSKFNSMLQNIRPTSGSITGNSVVPNKDITRKLLEQELNSLRQWKKGMKQWDSEFSASSHNRQEEATAWKQFLDQQMQVIAKKLERRISAALQK